MSFVKKLVFKIMEKVIDLSNKIEFDGYKEKYNRFGGRTLMIEIQDVDFKKGFILNGNEIKKVNSPNKYDIKVVIPKASTVFDLIRGTVKVRYPNGKIMIEKYTPKRAYLHGKIKVDGETGIIHDIEVLNKVFEDVAPSLRPKLAPFLRFG